MNANSVKSASNETQTRAINGWRMLLVNLALVIGAAVWLIEKVVLFAIKAEQQPEEPFPLVP